MRDQNATARRARFTPRAAGLLFPAVCFVVALASFNAAQQPRTAEQPDMTIDAATRTQVIEGTLKHLREGYVYPEVATRMEQAIRERAAKKEYEGITSGRQLAQRLTEHLQAVSRDKHLRVNYRAAKLGDDDIPGSARIVRRAPEGGGSPADGAGGRRIIREPGGAETPAGGAPVVVRRAGGGAGEASGNLGLEKVETLDGNVGLLDFSMFDPSEEANAKVSEAMSRLADTDALIIDLRRCRGGARRTITLLMSYFFDKSIHLSDAYDRIADSTQESWSLADVPGRRYGQKDVYILTSNFTFSAAEDISYTLKNLKRAIIVGETTGGGAHPVMGRRLNDHFFVMVPFARYISPITKSNWEGTGVEPDIKVPAAHALKIAQLAALKKISARKTDAKASAQLKGLIETLQREVDELKKESSKS
ncbi:MAG: S41 family peptidase [Acidobacteria bacterium]|nr:S41 family peptidase [Acidobacteriota bacterium]